MSNFKEILKKIPGFRSNVTWKKVISIVYYLFSLLMLTAEFQMFLFFLATPFFIFYLKDLIKNKKNKDPIKKEVTIVAIAFFLMYGSVSTSPTGTDSNKDVALDTNMKKETSVSDVSDKDASKLEKKTVVPVTKNNVKSKDTKKVNIPKEKEVKKTDISKKQKIKKIDTPKKDEVKSLGISLSDLKLIFGKSEIGFTFTDSPLTDGTPRQLGESMEGRGSGLLELYGKDKLVKVYLATFAANDSYEHNMFNMIYMSGLLKHVTPEFENSEAWLNESIGKVAGDPETPIIKNLGNKTVKLSLQEFLGMFELTIEAI